MQTVLGCYADMYNQDGSTGHEVASMQLLPSCSPESNETNEADMSLVLSLYRCAEVKV